MSEEDNNKNDDRIKKASVGQQFLSGFSAASKFNKSDVSTLKNRKNNQDGMTNPKSNKHKKNSDNDSDSLKKDDGLKENKKPEEKKSDDNKKSSKDKKSNSKSLKDNLKILGGKDSLSKKILKIKISLIAVGVALAVFAIIIIVGYFSAAFDTLLNSVSTFFGIPEADSEENMSEEEADGFFTKEEYNIDPDTGEPYSIESFVEKMKLDNDCSKITFWNSISDWFSELDGSSNSICTFIRHIEKKESDLEKSNEGLEMDRALAIASIFYGYAAQPSYTEYENVKEVDDIISPINHYDSLIDVLKNGKIKTADLDTMIDYSVFYTDYVYYEWVIKDEEVKEDDDEDAKRIGSCESHSIYKADYSLLKWQILMRYGTDVADAYQDYSNMASSYAATDNECKGIFDESTLLSKVAEGSSRKAILDTSVSGIINEMKSKNITGLDAFEQKATITGSNKDIFNNFNDIVFDYKTGFIYNKYPVFKEAFEDDRNNIEYDDAITPKEIESIINLIYERKPSFNDILGYIDQDDPYLYLLNANMDSSVVTGAYCGDFLTAPLDSIKVSVKDCNGTELLVTDFKDYIMGVAYGEVSNSNDDYVMSEMVAAISYALNRRNNYTKGSVISMRTGNCDQVYCSMKEGCHAEISNISCGSFNCTSYPPGGSGYHGKASADLYNKYAALYDRASDFLLVKDNKVFGAHYVSSIQNEWYSKASKGMSFTQIMQETYADEGAQLVRCSSLNTTTDDRSPDKNKVGNIASTEYPLLSPDFGVYYGFSYKPVQGKTNIIINPTWVKQNLVTVNTNCPEASWNRSFTVHIKAKSKYEAAFASMCKMLTDGVKTADGTCKYTTSDFVNGDTYVARNTSSGNVSLHSYGMAEDWNYDKSYTVGGKTYKPYGSNRSLTEYTAFYNALGGEEKCENVNYILWKYAYEPAGFIWGGNWGRNGNGATFDGMHFQVTY